MKTLFFALLLAPTVAMAQSAGLLYEAQPLQSESVLSGNMLGNDTELLTPQGIIDTPLSLDIGHEIGQLPQPVTGISATLPSL